jgi:DNA-binding MarR family transcriptional regulator
VSARKSKTAGAAAGGRGEAIAELLLEVAQFNFRLRAAGKRMGLVTSWGAGAFGFLRSLALLGPLTVPQIAEMRPTSRQRMQRLADELAADGLVAFVDNPRHRRSKLVRLTREGEARYRDLHGRLAAFSAVLGGELSDADVSRTVEIVRRLSGKLKCRLERGQDPPERETILRRGDKAL